jgi:HTH-type transcriptional repressor of NAD biosynthesis genes
METRSHSISTGQPLALLQRLSRLLRRRDVLVGTAASATLAASSFLGWAPFSTTEVFAFVSGALCVWLLVKENAWNWPVGIVNAALFVFLFYRAHLYADMGLQWVFIVLGFGGWYYWLHGGEGHAERRIAHVGVFEAAVVLALVSAATYGLTLYLRQIADAAPFWDALTTALSLAATYLQARKLIEGWWFWVAADLIYIPLYFTKALPLTGVLYVVFLAMCLRGLYDWTRTHQEARRPVERPDAAERFGLAVVAGKFYPFHTGHKYLIESALARADRVVVFVCYRPGEAIPGELRAAWVKATLPAAEVMLIDQDAEGLGESDDSRAWARWTLARLGCAPDAVFSSEDYGDTWAKEMGAQHVAVDKARQAVPISGTEIRRDPLGNLAYLAPVVRSYFVKRVCVLGAESTGKSTLARQLADHYKTLWVPEYGHAYSVFREATGQAADWTTSEFLLIGQTQNWLEDFLAGHANRVLFADTDAFTTACFHEEYLGEPAPAVTALAAGRGYDLYLLTDLETPFAQDEFDLRTDGPHRARMHAAYKRHLERSGADYLEVAGSPEERLAQAIACVDELLAAPALTPRPSRAPAGALVPALRLAEGL